MGLKEDIAAHKSTSSPSGLMADIVAHKAQTEADAEFDKQLLASPTEGMSTPAKLGAGFISGLMNVGQGAGNMMGLVDDETITERKGLEAPLSDTTAGSIGQFGGEMAALAPLGAVGTGAKVLGGGQKALRGTAAALEGAGAGAILANPNERGQGAALGAGTGLILNKAMAGLSRVGKDGLVKVKPSAEKLGGYVEKMTGKRPFTPLAQAADKDKLSRAGKFVFSDAAGLLNSARNSFEKQSDDLLTDVYEANIRQAWGGFGKKQADIANKVLRETGDMQLALEAGKNAGKKGEYSASQDVLDTAARSSLTGNYSPQQLLKASKSGVAGDIGYAPFREVGKDMLDVLGTNLGESSVASRNIFRGFTDTVGDAAAILPGPGALLGSKTWQNMLMGQNPLQRGMREGLDTRSGKVFREGMSGVRRTASGQPAEKDESDDMVTAQELLANALRGDI